MFNIFSANPGIRVFGFHANVNKEIDTTEPGEIAGDVTVVPSKTYNDIYYFNPNTKLSIGDTVYYWVYVQHNFLGYRYEGKWKVTGNLCTSYYYQYEYK